MRKIAKILFRLTGLAMMGVGIFFLIRGFQNNEFNQIIGTILNKDYSVVVKLGLDILLIFTGIVVHRCGRLACGGPFYFVFMTLLIGVSIWFIISSPKDNGNNVFTELLPYLGLWLSGVIAYVLLIISSIAAKKANKK